MRFCECLAYMLEEEGITKGELAKRSGLSNTAVCNWVSGNNIPDVERATKVFNALGYRVLLVKDEDVKKICK